jgi:formylglycine-generating enzyme required for sulfatase activity
MKKSMVFVALCTCLQIGCGGSSESNPASGGAGGNAGGAGGSGSTPTTCAAPGSDITWVTIPAGTFTMGCSASDTTCKDAEKPTRSVKVASFQLSATEITQAQFANTKHDNEYSHACPNCPADAIKWAEASAFCASVGGRLPTEAEWEYAARGGSTTVYPCGSASCLDQVAWSASNSDGVTHEVGKLSPNAFCLYDMLGNTWEWVQDYWHDTYDGAPADSSAWETPSSDYRVLRGNNFAAGSAGLRSSQRTGDYPDIYFVGSPGFRCARSL